MKHPRKSTGGREAQALSVAEAAAILGLSRVTTYRAVRRGDLPSFRIGGRILIPRRAVAELLRTGEGPRPSGAGDD